MVKILARVGDLLKRQGDFLFSFGSVLTTFFLFTQASLQLCQLVSRLLQMPGIGNRLARAERGKFLDAHVYVATLTRFREGFGLGQFADQ